MATSSAALVSNGRGGVIESSALTHLAAGMMVTRNLKEARRFYEDFFGFECAEYAPGRMLMRDRRAKYLMEHGARDFFVIDVREVEEIEHPQKLLNHWGFSVSSPEEVNRVHTTLKAEMDKHWVRKVRPVTQAHGSHGFYFIDNDENWWEVEYRNGMTNDGFFSVGDHDTPTLDEAMKIDPPLDLARTPSIMLEPGAFMSHGTTDVVDVARSRRFYEEVLDLRSVQQYAVAQYVAGGGDFAIVGVQTGKQTAQQGPENRWILLVDDDDQLQALRERTLAAREEFDVKEIRAIIRAERGSSFMICTADYNWFEISTCPRSYYVEIFERAFAGAQ